MKNREKEMTQEEIIMTADEVGKYLKLGMTTVYRLLRERQIPAVKIQRQYRIPKSKLDQWVMDNLYAKINMEE